MNRIAVITGANRGIGLAIARELADRGLEVILTCRDEMKGKKALKELENDKRKISFHPMDVTNVESIYMLKKFLRTQYAAIDFLINNAGIISSSSSISASGIEEIRSVMGTNFFGPIEVTQALLPLLQKSQDARIINISSGMGAREDLDGSYAGYRLSKAGLNNFTQMLASDLDGSKVKVYSMCPGWVKTDMGGPAAPRTVEEGADTAVWLATETPAPETGKFYRDRKIISY